MFCLGIQRFSLTNADFACCLLIHAAFAARALACLLSTTVAWLIIKYSLPKIIFCCFRQTNDFLARQNLLKIETLYTCCVY